MAVGVPFAVPPFAGEAAAPVEADAMTSRRLATAVAIAREEEGPFTASRSLSVD